MIAPALVLSLALSGAAPPAWAQEQAGQEQSLLDWGLSWFGYNLGQELAPALGDLRALADQFGPAIAPAIERLVSLVDDMTNYELPEMQENGDILIRRKPEAPVVQPPAGDGVTL